MIGGVLAVVVALVVALAVSLSSSGPTSSNGCIYLTIAAPTGAQQIHECGAQARSTCDSARTPGAFTADAADAIAAACRKARLPVGP